ncbi:MAG: family 20 glycosylhydrolase [Mangrovibacterium sp.]
MNRLHFQRLILLLGIGLLFSCSTEKDPVPALIPMPRQLEWRSQQFDMADSSARFVQRIVAGIPQVELNDKEAYSLKVSADSVILEATTEMGIFRGLQTVKQLIVEKNGKRFLHGCTIVDWPAFSVRGFMQDVGRNYMPVSLLKEQIDVMAAYKFNVFHFHVTDNPAWRLESKVYPQLADSASMTRWPGKFYSKDDFIELVDYCNERFITLIPEFDIPGHSEAFRKAFAIDSMSDVRVQPILLDLIDELCELVPPDKMPYIHLGTDEVWHQHERPAPELLAALVERVEKHGREVIVWRPGQLIGGDDASITQLWSSAGSPKPGHRCLDSRLNYLNHLDPLAGVPQLYFDRICGAARGDSLRLGGILCCWNDNNVTEPNDILRQNPVYPGMLTYSETSWCGQKAELGEEYLAKMPERGTALYEEFQNFEDRLCQHRDRYFKGKPFPYVRQTRMEWAILGPFSLDDPTTVNVLEEELLNNDKSVNALDWTGPYVGGTIHIRHFFGFPSYFSVNEGIVYATTNIWSPVDQEVDCWVGFHDWSRSGGRRGGPFPTQGQWHNTDPKVWLNGDLLHPPVWDNPGLQEKTEEIAFTDENYFFRNPTKIALNKGWNKVLLRVPQKRVSWKWMFTFVPVRYSDGVVREMNELKFSVDRMKI